MCIHGAYHQIDCKRPHYKVEYKKTKSRLGSVIKYLNIPDYIILGNSSMGLNNTGNDEVR